MKNRHLFIITYNWPPRNAIGTHRPYAWAKEWSSCGGRVTVLTAQKYAFDEPLDLTLPTLPGVEVIEVVWGSVTGRLSLKLIGNERLRNFSRRLLATMKGYFRIQAEPRQGWLVAALPIAQKLAGETDIVISTFGPAMSHQLGAAMKKSNPNLFWVADYRDLWSQSHIGTLTSRQRATMKSLECSTVGVYADMLSAVSEDMVKQLTTLTGKQVLLLPNGFDLDEQVITTRLLTIRQNTLNGLRIVHTGMLYEGKRNPEPLLLALAELFEEGLIGDKEVSIDFYGSRIDVARSLAERPEYHRFINLIGHVPREQALKAQESADILLLLESSEPAARGVLTGKVFEYLVSGTPILSIGSLRDYEIPNLLEHTKTGISFESNEIKKLKIFIIDLLRTNKIPDFFKPDINIILNYSRKRQTLKFFEIIDK